MNIPPIDNKTGVFKDSVFVYVPKTIQGLFSEPRFRTIGEMQKTPLILTPPKDTIQLTEKLLEEINNKTDWTKKIKDMNTFFNK